MAADAGIAGEGSLEALLRALRPVNALSPYHALAAGAGLFPQFAAVAARLRPGMDCWIPVEKLDAFRRFVGSQGLAMTVDCAFRALPEAARDAVVGIETLCTTHALGIRIEDASKGDSAHVFVAHSAEAAEELRRCGWYPVVVGGRLFHKPFVDHLAFGRRLGYPPCCIDFFAASNNWNRTNSYAEAFLASARFDRRANCFGKNRGYSLNFHIPCRFDCAATIGFSAALLSFLEGSEPDYAAACRALLGMPVLSLNEREIVALDGAAIGEGRLRYRAAADLFATAAPVMAALAAGNIVETRGRFLLVFRDAELVDSFECRADEYGPRVPLLLSWN
jgi:hypothetical protein